MISHYFTLRALCDELGEEFSGAILRESYTRVKDEMAMTLETAGGGIRTLVICVGASPDALFTREGRSRAKRNSADIFPGIFGSTISGIAVDEFERIVTIVAGESRVRIHLFGGAASNVFLVDPAGVVESALNNGRELSGQPYLTGKTEREVVAPDDAVRLAALLAESGGQPLKALKSAFPWLGGLYTRELLFRCTGGTSAASVVSAGAAGEEFALSALRHLREMLAETSRPSPRHYVIEGFEGPVLSVIPLHHLRADAPVSFAGVNEAVRETFFARKNRSGFDEERERLLASAAKEREKIARALSQAKSHAEDVSAPEIHRKAGGLILTHINEIRKGQTEVELSGEEGDPPVRIRLDRSLTPAGNANLYFDRARKAEKALAESSRRAVELSAKLAGIDAWIGELGECDDPAGLRAILEARKKNSRPAKVVIGTAGGERLPFRVFPIGEDFEAWVGKSSADNDLLTMKHAGPHDFWFHVRGASGSHVVLKNRTGGKTPPPREVIRTAARLAAYYSKMRKAGNVPVAYCERKYVKKPKNAPPGTVTLQREEIVFVTPAIP
jgi:predicted ribosome quality control (RQC) complex YloA/Tae2 family protein